MERKIKDIIQEILGRMNLKLEKELKGPTYFKYQFKELQKYDIDSDFKVSIYQTKSIKTGSARIYECGSILDIDKANLDESIITEFYHFLLKNTATFEGEIRYNIMLGKNNHKILCTGQTQSIDSIMNPESPEFINEIRGMFESVVMAITHLLSKGINIIKAAIFPQISIDLKFIY
ncbi:MAG: hypothetical protein ACTSQI_17875 [Candidatus Helarchaeota archaeon]